jgi:hypothetical protein
VIADSRSQSQEWAQLVQVGVEDRLAARVAELCDQLADAGVGDAGIGAQQALDLGFEGVELGGSEGSLITRRKHGAQRRPDRVARRPVRLAISMIVTPSTTCIRLICAYRSTSSRPSFWLGLISIHAAPTALTLS